MKCVGGITPLPTRCSSGLAGLDFKLFPQEGATPFGQTQLLGFVFFFSNEITELMPIAEFHVYCTTLASLEQFWPLVEKSR